MTRREVLSLAAAAAAAPDFSEVRKNFPRAVKETYFNAAAQHPLGLHAVAGGQRYIDFMSHGWAGGGPGLLGEGVFLGQPVFARAGQGQTAPDAVFRRPPPPDKKPGARHG